MRVLDIPPHSPNIAANPTSHPHRANPPPIRAHARTRRRWWVPGECAGERSPPPSRQPAAPAAAAPTACNRAAWTAAPIEPARHITDQGRGRGKRTGMRHSKSHRVTLSTTWFAMVCIIKPKPSHPAPPPLPPGTETIGDSRRKYLSFRRGHRGCRHVGDLGLESALLHRLAIQLALQI